MPGGFASGPVACSGLAFDFKTSGAAAYQLGAAKTCDGSTWEAALASTPLLAFRLGQFGAQWGTAMGGNSSTGHDTYWYVR